MSTKNLFPEGAISTISGSCIILKGNDIDTDRIIPARFLKCVNFQDLGEQVFADDRNELKGKHPFDLSVHQGASILVVNDNFGCGSSREHAPQALMRWGIRAIIGLSFAEIFYGNCLALGIPCATISEKKLNSMQKAIQANVKQTFELNLNKQLLKGANEVWKITVSPGPRQMLTSGCWDGTSQLISQKIALRETMKSIPYLNNFST